MGSSWIALEQSEGKKSRLGIVLGRLGVIWGRFGVRLRGNNIDFSLVLKVFVKNLVFQMKSFQKPSLMVLGPSCGGLGPSWDRLGAVLGRLWDFLGGLGTPEVP